MSKKKTVPDHLVQESVTRRGVLVTVAALSAGGAAPDPQNLGLFMDLDRPRVPASTTVVRTSGFATLGIGGATYRETRARGETVWRFQAADGRWFELSEPIVSPEMFGAVGDGREHPLTERYRDPARVRRHYPFAKSDDQIDFCAWQAALIFGGRIRARANARYRCLTRWPQDASGHPRSGTPENFRRLIVTQDSSVFGPVSPSGIIIDGAGATLVDGVLLIHKHRGAGSRIENLTFQDTLSDGKAIPDGKGGTIVRAIYFLFKWWGLSGWSFVGCTWESPRLPADADEPTGWLWSLPNQGYENADILFERCHFKGRTEIDLWGGRNYRFIDNVKSAGGFDDGLTAKTWGERDDPLYTGDIDGVEIRGNRWRHCNALFCAGSDMRWACRNVRIVGNHLEAVGAIFKLKPDGRGSAVSSRGVVEDVIAEDNVLTDLKGERFLSAFQFQTGEGPKRDGAGTIRRVRARRNKIVARPAAQVGADPSRHLILFAPFEGKGQMIDIWIEDLDYTDPQGGKPRAKGRPGRPLSNIIDTSVANSLVTPANIVNCGVRRLKVSGVGGGHIDPLWQVDGATLDQMFQDTVDPQTPFVTRRGAPHRGLVLQRTAPERMYQAGSR